MEEQIPTSPLTDPVEMHRIRHGLDRLIPFVWPVLVSIAVLALVGIALFAVVAVKHLDYGWETLNMSDTGNVGQFISGTVGTAFGIISTLLLILTLWVQISEYRLTRQELMNTVLAQRDMAKAQELQLQPLREQANIARQAMETDLLTRAILDLKDDIQAFDGRPIENARGCARVLTSVAASFNQVDGWRQWAIGGRNKPQVDEYIGWSARALIAFDVILERAEMILADLATRDLPRTSSLIRRKELILFINNELRGLANPLSNMKMNLFTLPNTDLLVKRFKEQSDERLQGIIDRLVAFSQMDVSKLD